MPAYTEKFIDAGSCRTRYVEAGAGDVLILLHSVDPGGSGSLEYRENIEMLSRTFRVIAPDLMGFGGTSLPDGPIENVSESYTAHIIAFLDALGLNKVHLAGNSRGGLISIAIATAQPARVDKIVLLANAGGGVSPEYLKKQQAIYANFRPTRDQMRGFLADSYASIDRNMSEEIFDEYCSNAIKQYDRYDSVGGLPQDVPDLRPQLAMMAQPILYVFGANDKRWPPIHDGIDVYVNTPNARYYNIADCGHHPQTEAPEEINFLMTAFLTGCIGQSLS